MRLLHLVSALVLFLVSAAAPTASFHPATRIAVSSPCRAAGCRGALGSLLPRARRDVGDDDFEWDTGGYKPETSFGAEAVPEDQRPANEYLDLIRQPLFAWADQERGDGGLAARLGATYLAFGVLICYPIAGATYTQDGYLLNKIAAANVGALSVVLVLLVRLYSGWGYVGSRLQSKVIEYEESGWYDGDIEYKTDTEKARDLFLYRQDVRPVEDRLKLFSAAIAGVWIASIIGLNVAASANPIFNEYDADMLKTLTYDEKLANTAAQKSGGRPTYCDSRYYRAVAGGGQGEN